jgi:hypothetical protein
LRRPIIDRGKILGQIMHPLVKKLEDELVPEFKKIAGQIEQTIPHVTARIESHSIGSGEHLGHSIAISCLFTKDYPTEVDDVALSVALSHLVSTPKITASVCWGYPSAHVEAEFPRNVNGMQNNSVTVSDEILKNLSEELPRLHEALFAALERRQPPDQ